MFHSNFRIFLLLIASLVTLGFSQGEAKEAGQKAQIESDEEAFLIRRIAEFWKDGDFPIVKTQIIDFLDKYSESALSDYFHGILGDIYLQEGNYQKALISYQNIKEDKEIIGKTLLNKLQCYYELDQYDQLANDGRPYLSSKVKEIQERKEEFYFLIGEALFRQALEKENDQEKISLAQEACGYYESISKGQYNEIVEFALAEIYAMTGEYEKGAAAYRDLAEKHFNMREDLLFQVASLEAKYNKLEAEKTFKKVKDLRGKRSNEAAYNILVLLFQNEEYKEVIESYAALSPSVPQEHLPTFNFIIGKSYFSLGQYQNAISSLKKYIESMNAPSDQLKNALLIQMTCAHQVCDEKLFNEAFQKLDTFFPDDQEIPTALFMHAMILKEEGKLSQADEKLKMIKDNYVGFDNEESFIFEYGLLAHQNERWQESYESFKLYVIAFPESTRIGSAWKLFLSSSLNLYKHRNDESEYTKELFFGDLQAVLSHSHYLNEKELKDYSLLYSKTAYELDHFSKALCCLQDHIFTNASACEDTKSLAEAHFIAGLCHAEMGVDHSAFCMHLEQAMTLHPALYDVPSTHLQLYNAYISLAGFGEAKGSSFDALQQQEFISHAVEHLEEAISKGDIEIKDENRLWLANHYYQLVKEYYEEDFGMQNDLHPEITNAMDRASEHFRKLLLKNGKLIPISSETLHLENEVIKFAKLLSFQNQNPQKLELLKQLLHEQSEHIELNWSSQKEAIFELAMVYDALGEKEKAFETYTFIHASALHFPRMIANQSALEAARLHFELLEDGMKTEKNQEVLSILNDLKELQIRKNAGSEPIHLEAALEYAKIRTLLSDKKEQDSRYLFFLDRIKDDFTSKEDLLTQNYLKALNHDQEKKQVFDAYMKFIDAERMRLEAKNLGKQERLGEMEEIQENALTLYGELKNNPNIPRDLYDRISVSIEEINRMNAY
jgi:lipopolysaccharide biosynthesis regulator YciM